MNIRSTGYALASGAMFTLNEVSEASKNDPALAMRISATALTDTLLNKVNEPIKESFQQTVVPVVRGGILALNAVRCVQTFKKPESTKLDKFMDVGRVASDLVGFVGGVAVLAHSQYAELGRTLMGFSYAVDAVSHAYRGLEHASNRVTVWKTMLAEAKQAEREREAKQEEEKRKNPPVLPQDPSGPQNPTKPVSADRVKVCIEGSASAAAAILRGEKPMMANPNPVTIQ